MSVRSEQEMCTRCGDHPRSPDEEFCPICVISIKVEVARGMQQLTEYLRGWAAFSDWCDTHASTA